jgi:hypothetical protein
MSIALRQNWRTAPSRPALRQLLRVDRLEQPSGRLPASPKFACRCARFSAPWFHSVYTAHAASSRTGCVLSVLASKIQTWSHMASASRAELRGPERSIPRRAMASRPLQAQNHLPTGFGAAKLEEAHVPLRAGGRHRQLKLREAAPLAPLRQSQWEFGSGRHNYLPCS